MWCGCGRGCICVGVVDVCMCGVSVGVCGWVGVCLCCTGVGVSGRLDGCMRKCTGMHSSSCTHPSLYTHPYTRVYPYALIHIHSSVSPRVHVGAGVSVTHHHSFLRHITPSFSSCSAPSHRHCLSPPACLFGFFHTHTPHAPRRNWTPISERVQLGTRTKGSRLR